MIQSPSSRTAQRLEGPLLIIAAGFAVLIGVTGYSVGALLSLLPLALVAWRRVAVLFSVGVVLLLVPSVAYPLVRISPMGLTLTNTDIILWLLVGASLAHLGRRSHQAASPPRVLVLFAILVAIHLVVALRDGIQAGEWPDARSLTGLAAAVPAAAVAATGGALSVLRGLKTAAVVGLAVALPLVAWVFIAEQRALSPLGFVDPGSTMMRSGAEPLLILMGPYLVGTARRGWGLLVRAVLLALLILSQTFTIVVALAAAWVFVKRPWGRAAARGPGLAQSLALTLLGVLLLLVGVGRTGDLGRFDPGRIDSNSAGYRLEETKTVLSEWTGGPLSVAVGKGFGSTFTFGDPRSEVTGYAVITKGDTHNFFVNVLFKFGVLGLLLVSTLIRNCFRALRQLDPAGNLAVGFVALVLSSISAPFLWTIQGWAILALLTIAARARHRRPAVTAAVPVSL